MPIKYSIRNSFGAAIDSSYQNFGQLFTPYTKPKRIESTLTLTPKYDIYVETKAGGYKRLCTYSPPPGSPKGTKPQVACTAWFKSKSQSSEMIIKEGKKLIDSGRLNLSFEDPRSPLSRYSRPQKPRYSPRRKPIKEDPQPAQAFKEYHGNEVRTCRWVIEEGDVLTYDEYGRPALKEAKLKKECTGWKTVKKGKRFSTV